MSISYWNNSRKLASVVLFFSLGLVLTGCTSTQGPSRDSLEPGRQVDLRLRGEPGLVRVTKYYSHSYVRDYEMDQIIKEKDEIVDFDIVETVKSRTEKGLLEVDTTAKNKDGIVDLHDLAFPEEEEVIKYIYTPKGQVLSAGQYPKESIFYVPPMPLPSTEVEVGDTWEQTSQWVSLKNGIPLSVSVVGILKDLFKCGEDICADIEISGQVAVPGASQANISFSSEISGHVFYSVNRGISLWSEIRSTEDLRLENNRTFVKSCVVSQLKKPAGSQSLFRSLKLKCDPKKTR